MIEQIAESLVALERKGVVTDRQAARILEAMNFDTEEYSSCGFAGSALSTLQSSLSADEALARSFIANLLHLINKKAIDWKDMGEPYVQPEEGDIV